MYHTRIERGGNQNRLSIYRLKAVLPEGPHEGPGGVVHFEPIIWILFGSAHGSSRDGEVTGGLGRLNLAGAADRLDPRARDRQVEVAARRHAVERRRQPRRPRGWRRASRPDLNEALDDVDVLDVHHLARDLCRAGVVDVERERERGAGRGARPQRIEVHEVAHRQVGSLRDHRSDGEQKATNGTQGPLHGFPPGGSNAIALGLSRKFWAWVRRGRSRGTVMAGVWEHPGRGRARRRLRPGCGGRARAAREGGGAAEGQAARTGGRDGPGTGASWTASPRRARRRWTRR